MLQLKVRNEMSTGLSWPSRSTEIDTHFVPSFSLSRDLSRSKTTPLQMKYCTRGNNASRSTCIILNGLNISYVGIVKEKMSILPASGGTNQRRQELVSSLASRRGRRHDTHIHGPIYVHTDGRNLAFFPSFLTSFVSSFQCRFDTDWLLLGQHRGTASTASTSSTSCPMRWPTDGG